MPARSEKSSIFQIIVGLTAGLMASLNWAWLRIDTSIAVVY